MSPYHAGEKRIQELAGEVAIAERNGAVIAKSIIKGAIPFIGQQRMLVCGSVDSHGKPWASVLFGETAFATSNPEGTHIVIDRTKLIATTDDIFWINIQDDRRIGLLAIELSSRRRLRVNGQLGVVDSAQLIVNVEESYPNCPKYIQRRHLRMISETLTVPDDRGLVTQTALDFVGRKIIEEADTLFVSTVNGNEGVDASHRGGVPGFVEIRDDTTLRIPDYTGNSMFNTLGNIAVYPYCGLCLYSFATGDVLQISGVAQILFGQADDQNRTGGSHRFWEVSIREIRRWRLGATANWEYLDASPFNPLPTES